MQVNLPSFQKNDFILSLVVYNYYKKDICLAISHYVLNRQTKLFKALFGLFFLDYKWSFKFFSLIFCGDQRITRRTLWI